MKFRENLSGLREVANLSMLERTSTASYVKKRKFEQECHGYGGSLTEEDCTLTSALRTAVERNPARKCLFKVKKLVEQRS